MHTSFRVIGVLPDPALSVVLGVASAGVRRPRRCMSLLALCRCTHADVMGSLGLVHVVWESVECYKPQGG
jgi:hypothetical protein